MSSLRCLLVPKKLWDDFKVVPFPLNIYVNLRDPRGYNFLQATIFLSIFNSYFTFMLTKKVWNGALSLIKVFVSSNLDRELWGLLKALKCSSYFIYWDIYHYVNVDNLQKKKVLEKWYPHYLLECTTFKQIYTIFTQAYSNDRKNFLKKNFAIKVHEKWHLVPLKTLHNFCHQKVFASMILRLHFWCPELI